MAAKREYTELEINSMIDMYISGMDVLMGVKKSRWTKKHETKQLQKINWVNENIIPVEIVIVDKNKISKINLI